MKRTIIRVVLSFLFHLLTRIEVRGLENIPASGGCILCTNHLSSLDAAFAFIYLKRDDATGLAGDTHQQNPLFNWLLTAVNVIWINREELDMRALRTATEYLKDGHILGIAPEGTRSRTHAMIQAKTGIAYLADKACVPIVPMAVTGTDKAVAQLKRLRRQRITLTVGKPIFLRPVDRKNRDRDLQRNTDEIMCQIAAMLPEHYRGVYADHPRLKEILSGSPSEVDNLGIDRIASSADNIETI